VRQRDWLCRAISSPDWAFSSDPSTGMLVSSSKSRNPFIILQTVQTLAKTDASVARCRGIQFQTLFKLVRVWHFNNNFNLADLVISGSQLDAATSIYNTLELL
jgi:hypothetical protein